MTSRLMLASASEIRQKLLRNAGLSFDVAPVKIDEASLRDALIAEGAPPRDIADQLADFKARRAATKHPQKLVIGCDQILEHDRQILAKPKSMEHALTQLHQLNAQKHRLMSAAVIYEGSKPVWRHVGIATLTMRANTDAFLQAYVARNWHSIQHSVGGYKLEEEGVRLFQRIEGDYFTILGLPLLEILAYLTLRGEIEG